MPSHTNILKGQWVFPSDGPPIKNGVLTIRDNVIVSISEDLASADGLSPTVRDLGNVAILPTLVNGHAHLEFSDLTEPVAVGPRGMADWIRSVIHNRSTRGASADPIARGLQESIAAGVGYIGEIATTPSPSATMDEFTIQGTRFLELIEPRRTGLSDRINTARAFLSGATSVNWANGLSPHAPYTTTLKLVEASVDLANEFNVPVAMHLAETKEELQLLRDHSGPLRQLLDERTLFDGTAFPVGTRPLDYLKRLSKANRSFIIHGNYLDTEELQFIAKHRQRMTLVYCPRTHDHFGHDNYPLNEAFDLGISISFGTDSRASNPDLSVFNEAKRAFRKHTEVSPSRLFGMITNADPFAFDTGLREGGMPTRLTIVDLPDDRSQAEDPFESLFATNSTARNFEL